MNKDTYVDQTPKITEVTYIDGERRWCNGYKRKSLLVVTVDVEYLTDLFRRYLYTYIQRNTY